MHNEILPECTQIFKRIEEKIDNLIASFDKINGRYERHMEEAVYYRSRVERHDEKMKILTWLFGILTAPVIFLIIKLLSNAKVP